MLELVKLKIVGHGYKEILTGPIYLTFGGFTGFTFFIHVSVFSPTLKLLLVS